MARSPGAEPDDAEAGSDRSAELLARWQQDGDPAALDQFLQEEIRYLKARIRRGGWKGFDPSASVSDVAQDAVFRMLRLEDPPHFDHPGALRAYLWKAAWHLLVNRLRDRGPGAGTSPTWSDPGLDQLAASTGGLGEVEGRDHGLAIRLAVQLMPVKDREILELVYFQDRGIQGAADVIGITRDAASTRLVRARNDLARKLRSWADLIG